MDRQVLSFLAPLLQVKIGWTEAQYSYIVSCLSGRVCAGASVRSAASSIGSAFELGYALTIVVWSAGCDEPFAGADGAFVRVSRASFSDWRESGNFPAAMKTVAEWFPKKERALATGLFNSGTSVGAILVPLAVPWIAVTHLGWQVGVPLYRRIQLHLARLSGGQLTGVPNMMQGSARMRWPTSAAIHSSLLQRCRGCNSWAIASAGRCSLAKA
jgi:sugar phosphate permease